MTVLGLNCSYFVFPGEITLSDNLLEGPIPPDYAKLSELGKNLDTCDVDWSAAVANPSFCIAQTPLSSPSTSSRVRFQILCGSTKTWVSNRYVR
jgi:hypothetical protein